VHTQRGFTLIELLIVVVIIGILAALAIPKFANTKEKTYLAQMKSDLRNYATAQEAFFYDSAYYTMDLSALGGWKESSGVTVTPNEATAGGWSATATHAQAALRECYLYSGTATPVGPPGTVDGKITCK
jgi:type IV pilus assembly protein PilA